jgi:molecular chaperone DnaK (HSP70)
MTEKPEYQVVVGIDFGSSGSGFAYSFMDENKIYHSDIPGADVEKKVPTEIILNDKNEILEFGAKCNSYLKTNGLNSGHYFKGIKMHLYNHKKEITSCNTNKTLPLQLVIEKVLSKLKDLCLDQMNKAWKFIEESLIKWVVTVPAIWGDFEKEIMMKECEEIGLVNENCDKSLFFALEPESASLYCSRNDNIRKEFLEPGKYYIICDLGGGTGDIVTHMIGSNKNVEEITPSCGGNYGSNEIDKKIFKNIIYKLFGFEDFNSLLKKYKEKEKDDDDDNDEESLYQNWCDLEKDIRDFKKDSNKEKIENKKYYPISCALFQDFFEENITDLVNKYNEQLKDNELKLVVKSKKKWMIEFPYKIIDIYMQEQANQICQEIKDILSRTKKEINTIMFVGGYCSNEVIISKIRNGLGEHFYYLQPSNPCLAIMEGAVLFGINPSIIGIRISKYTIGLEINTIWDEKKHSNLGEKYFSVEENVYRCKNCFYKFIEINQKLEYNKTIKYDDLVMRYPRSCSLTFYKSIK